MNLNQEIQINGDDGQIYQFREDGQLLGQGAFGKVVKGKNILNQDVAVKIVRKQSGQQMMLKREIGILKALANTQNENIVSLFAVKETAHEVFMVMEYCNYKDFGHYLSKIVQKRPEKGVLSEVEIEYFFKQVVNGLKTLHEKKIIHRDLKPENLMLSNPTGVNDPPFYELVVKISDFGLSRVLPEGSLASTFCGTPYYMAPEVVLNQNYDSKADVWSLGMIIYECLTNSLPLKEESIRDRIDLMNFYQTKAKFNLEMPKNITKELSDIIVKSLEQNIQERMCFEHFISNPFFTNISKNQELIKNIKCLKEEQKCLKKEHECLKKEHELTIKCLFEHDTDIELQYTEGETCLMAAIYENKMEIARYLADSGADVNRKDKNGDTALLYAARIKNDNKLIVELLLKRGADIEHQNTRGNTCLMVAARKNNIEIVRYLLKKGADLNKNNNNGETALFEAAKHSADNVLLVKLLLEHDTDIDIEHQNSTGNTLFMIAVNYENIKIVHYLLEKGADSNRRNNNGDTALFYAAENEDEQMAELLLKRGVDINHQNIEGKTCLMAAVYNNRTEMVHYLLEKGADPNSINNSGKTALHIAKEQFNKEIIKLLSKYI